MASLFLFVGMGLLFEPSAEGQILPRRGSVVMHDLPMGDMDDEVIFTNPLIGGEGASMSVSDPMGMEPQGDWGLMSGGADFGLGCPPRTYAIAEAFALRREGNSNFSLSSGGRFDSYDYDLAGRITIGRTYDCLDGWEASYAGPFRWKQEFTSFSDGNLQTFLLPGRALTDGDFAAFNNADSHRQTRTSELHSGEVSRRWWGWDVFSMKLGARYLRVEEGYELFSQSGGGFGTFQRDFQNDIGLVQLGIDMMAPLGPWTFGAKVNGGVGINFNSGSLLLADNGGVTLDNSNSSEQFAFLIEAGLFSIYRLTDRVSIHAGYEAWYLWGVATPYGQDNTPVNFDSGLSYYERDDIFYHGGTLGLEIVW